MIGRSGWEQAGNLLCIRLDTIGDVLMATPAVRALKESLSERRVTLLTSTAGESVAALIPELDGTLIYDAPWMKATPDREDSRHEYAMAGRLREMAFDGAVIFTTYSQSPLPAAFLCYLAGIPLRLAHCRENPYQLLTSWVPDPEPDRLLRHEVRRQLDLVSTIGCATVDERLSLRVPEPARLRVRALLAAAGLNPALPWAVIHPGATAPSRRYPWQAFAEVARRLVAELGWQVVFSGSAGEGELIEGIRSAMEAPSHSLAGRLDFAELAALIDLAPVLVVNNTGPAHIAAATGTPVVDLYALTNPQHTPWSVPSRVLSHDVPCKYCYRSICPQGHHNCLRLISPDDVVQAARELVLETRPKAALEKRS